MKILILVLFSVGLLCLIFSSLYDLSWGLIEIKEYKVINSKVVCGDKLCKEIDEIRSKKGLSTRDIKVCGNELCKYFDRDDLIIPKNIDTPLGKYKFGIPLHQITCKDGFELILKESNNNPACVKAENAIKLMSKGWALDYKSQKIVLAASQEKYSSKIILASYDTDNLLSASFDRVNDQDFIVFEGIGWHRLHNVEVTISNESEIIDSVRSKTTDHGRLWMHWPIPELLPEGQYYIYASDGVHQSELVIPLSGK